MKLHLILLSVVEAYALLHRPLSRDLSYETELLQRQFQSSPFLQGNSPSPTHKAVQSNSEEADRLQKSPSSLGPSKLRKRGSCLSRQCRERQSSPLQSSSDDWIISAGRGTHPRNPTPRYRSHLSANSLQPESTEPGRSIPSQVNGPHTSEVAPPRLPPFPGSQYPHRNLNKQQIFELGESFGQRLRRSQARRDPVQSDGNTETQDLVSPQRQSLDNASRGSSLGATSVAPRSKGSSHDKS